MGINLGEHSILMPGGKALTRIVCYVDLFTMLKCAHSDYGDDILSRHSGNYAEAEAQLRSSVLIH